MMTKPNYKNACFLLSAANLEQLPEDQDAEIAIIGRSNAGKSSVLNKLTQNKQLARVSKTPGRTQLLNVFVLDTKRRLIDLPGYGYAKVAKQTKERWQQLLDQYLRERDCLRGLLLVMDIRHPLKDIDKMILEWANASQLPVHVLLNKSDKLSLHQVKQTGWNVEKELAQYQNQVSWQALSTVDGRGIDELKRKCDEWLG